MTHQLLLHLVDRTGLTVNFDFDLRYVPNALRVTAPAADRLPNRFTAVVEQLGLKLESTQSSMT